MMNRRGKSDGSTVPMKLPNKAEGPAAEATEEKGLAKGNSLERNALRTQSRESAPSALERVRQAARKDKKKWFTALLHHIYEIDRLRTAHFAIKKSAAAGVDGVTWEHYGKNLRSTSRICPVDSSEERTGQGLSVACTSRRWVNRVSFAHSAFPHWKIRSSSAPRSKC
jgi:hypothetical protein